MTSVEVEIRFSPVDTWYFREARGHDSIGSGQLDSRFPPSPRTLMGALRTRIGDLLGIDWQQHATANGDTGKFQGMTYSQVVGQGDNTGELQLLGTSLRYQSERLYALPAMLLQVRESDQLVRLLPGQPMVCDLSKKSDLGQFSSVMLPSLPAKGVLARNITGAWVKRSVMEKILRGETPNFDELVFSEDLFDLEPRLGIARNAQQGTVKKGMLYQTGHLRLCNDVDALLNVSMPELLASELLQVLEGGAVQRLGGEGRMAVLQAAVGTQAKLKLPTFNSMAKGLILIAETPLPQAAGAVPFAGFESAVENVEGEAVQVWKGHLRGVALTILCAVQAKAVREGGWDARLGKPGKTISQIPAGSCWYVLVDNGDLNGAVNAIHGHSVTDNVGGDSGRLMCGIWN